MTIRRNKKFFLEKGHIWINFILPKMLKKGIDIKDISEITKLSIEQIEKIKEHE